MYIAIAKTKKASRRALFALQHKQSHNTNATRTYLSFSFSFFALLSYLKRHHLNMSWMDNLKKAGKGVMSSGAKSMLKVRTCIRHSFEDILSSINILLGVFCFSLLPFYLTNILFLNELYQ
jgi:hypothetical protein